MTGLRAHLSHALKSPKAYKLSAQARTTIAATARVAMMKRSLYRFITGIADPETGELVQPGAWSVIEGGRLEENWHLEAICNEIQLALECWLVANGRASARVKQKIIAHFWRHGLTFREGAMLVQNYIFNLPPVTLKSRIIMVFACAWLWLQAPDVKFGCSSANDENVRRDSLATQELVTSEWYRHTFAIKWTVNHRTSAVSSWSNTEGGKRTSRTFMAGFTGIHVDIILVDDPDDAMKVWNESTRKATQYQFSRAIENRVNNEAKCLRIVLQQRVHANDLTWFLRKLKRWSVKSLAGWALFVIPMEFGKGPKDAPAESVFGFTDPRSAPGELIQASRFSSDQLADKRVSMTDQGVEAQYNQNPDIIEGGLIPRADVRFFRLEHDASDPPFPRPDKANTEPAFILKYIADGRRAGWLDLDELALSVDCSFGSLKDSASNVGIVCAGRKGFRSFVFDDNTEVGTFTQTKERIRAMIRAYRITKVLIEKKANGASVIEDLENELALGVITEHEDGTITREPLRWPDGSRAIVKVESVEVPNDSKVARAMTMVPEYKAGLVFVLEGQLWNSDHIAEICTFPKGKKNDRVDCMAQFQAHYRDATTELNRAIAQARW